jgi:hypothetical protein
VDVTGRCLRCLADCHALQKRPERKSRVYNGERKARGPDDLASFDHCFVLDIDTTVTR